MTVIVAHFLSWPVAGRYLVGPTKSRGIDAMRHFLRLMFFGCLGVLVSSSARGGEYVQTNIVSDLTGVAPNVDPDLKNPWGMSFSATSPIWVSNQVSGTATLYNPLASPVIQDLTVTIPTDGFGPPSGPTGQVSNPNNSGFLVGNNGSPAQFIFANLNGTISAWNPSAARRSKRRPPVPSSPAWPSTLPAPSSTPPTPAPEASWSSTRTSTT